MELTRRLLEQFLAVVDEQHFGRAAERLSMSQPPLSQAIQRLEKGVGATLLERGPRGVRPTPAGTVFATDARRLLNLQDAALDRARRVAHGLEGDVRVGYVSILSHRHLPGLLREAAEAMPGLRIKLRQDSSASVAELVQTGALDLGFLRDPSPVPAGLVTRDVAVERLAAALPAGHRLAGGGPVGLAELRDEDFVLPDATALPALAQQLRLACHEAGFTPRPRAAAEDLTGLFSYVASGLCVSLLPEALDEFALPGVAFAPLRGESPTLDTRVTAVHRPEADAAVHRLLDLIARRMGG
ncbi:LysR family transcriptional regulator [Streptomyces caatingaensis]|uniref:LysR family transcriptional regulator n=1 Tax=Streptomyces caatingaensis TaxID=1678637 RepID=A0A0K9XID2_9ACTN|nr:LysR family transcriptional regulator [Streptomyces caatingaensis]KNB52796.1 LysR family transcriptional regulator [Streptomyces caatingaensis]